MINSDGWWFSWNMTFIFPYMKGIVIPIDELIFFRGLETTNQLGFEGDFTVVFCEGTLW